jgi:hypothetical protein
VGIRLLDNLDSTEAIYQDWEKILRKELEKGSKEGRNI